MPDPLYQFPYSVGLGRLHAAQRLAWHRQRSEKAWIAVALLGPIPLAILACLPRAESNGLTRGAQPAYIAAKPTRQKRAAGYISETSGLVTPTPDGLKAARVVQPAPSTPAERLALWYDRLPSPAPEMLCTLNAICALGDRTRSGL